MGIEEMNDREALTRIMARLGGLGDAERRSDDDENLYPYRPEADAILRAGFRRDAEPSEDAVWEALEPFLETTIRLDLNELEDNQSFAEMVKVVASALRTENQGHIVNEQIPLKQIGESLSRQHEVADSMGPVIEGYALSDWLGLSESDLKERRDERSIIGFQPKDSEDFLYPIFQFNDYGEAIPELISVLSTLDPQRVDDGSTAIWLNQPRAVLNGRTASEALRDGEVKLVLSAARSSAYAWRLNSPPMPTRKG